MLSVHLNGTYLEMASASLTIQALYVIDLCWQLQVFLLGSSIDFQQIGLHVVTCDYLQLLLDHHSFHFCTK